MASRKTKPKKQDDKTTEGAKVLTFQQPASELYNFDAAAIAVILREGGPADERRILVELGYPVSEASIEQLDAFMAQEAEAGGWRYLEDGQWAIGEWDDTTTKPRSQAELPGFERQHDTEVEPLALEYRRLLVARQEIEPKERTAKAALVEAMHAKGYDSYVAADDAGRLFEVTLKVAEKLSCKYLPEDGGE